MKNKKICISVDEKLYKAFQEHYPHSMRQAIEELMRRSVRNENFLWNFIHGCSFFSDDFREVIK